MDFDLYLECSQTILDRAPSPPLARGKSVSLRSSDTILPGFVTDHPNTCWRYQNSRCNSACAWPETHKCYTCSGPHLTKECGLTHTTANRREEMALNFPQLDRSPLLRDGTPTRERRHRDRPIPHSRDRIRDSPRDITKRAHHRGH